MSTFRQRIEIAARPDDPFEVLEALVDTGATYTQVAGPILERLGVDAIDSETFVMADGSRVERRVGEVIVRLDGRTRTTMVIFGDEAAMPLLGAVTLEEFGLGIDPLGRRLVPVPGYVVASQPGRRS